MKTLVLLLLVSAFAAGEDGPWYPDQHPASVTRSLTGFTRPARSVTVAAEDQSRVLAILVDEGAVVPGEPGSTSPVARLDDTLARADRDVAAARLAEAEARLRQARAGTAVAEREAAWWASEQHRLQALLAEGRAASRDADQATFQAERAALLVASNREAEGLAVASVAIARAALARAEAVVSRHTLRAPAGWVVSQRVLEPGALASPGAPLLQCEEVTTLEVPLRLGRDELAAVRAQASLGLVFAADGREVVARVASIDPRFDPVSRKREVVLALPGSAAPEAAGGLEVSCHIALPDPTGGVLVPETLVAQRFDQYLVFLATGGARPVVPLRREGSFLVISRDVLPQGAALVAPPAVAEAAE